MNKNGRFSQIILISLTFLFGLQALRVMFSLSLYVLRDRFGWTAIQIGILMFAFFTLSFLAGLFRRWLGTERMVMITAVGVGLFRLALQLWSGDPLIDLILALLTIFSFMLFVPVALGFSRSLGVTAVQDFALGMLLGVVFDVALHGAFRTYDMAWQSGWLTAAITLTLVIIQWLTAWLITHQSPQTTSQETDTTLGLALTWMAIGAFIFLELLIFGNLARFTVLTGWTQAQAFFVMLSAQIIGVLILAWLFNRNKQIPAIITAVLGLLLVATLFKPWPNDWLAAGQLVVGQVILALLMGTIVVGIGAGNGRSGLRNLTLSNGFSWLLMAVFVFLYYAGYDIPLPFSNDLLFPIAALITGICAFFAARAIPQAETMTPHKLGWAILLILLLLILPLSQFLDQPATAVTGDGFPVRVMNYNLHNGFDQMGYLGLEALAQVIEAENPDVVGLQEINRGWVVNGSTDMLEWLSQRLDMPYVVWGPTTGALWGNAVLSRLPLNDVDLQTLPPPNLLLKRGFIWTNVDVGNGESVNIINTHYHHKSDGSLLRTTQSQAILNYWAERPFTLIMGDLNAEPTAPEINIIVNKGFLDVLDENNIVPGYTNDALNPFRRIDYIFMTPDLMATNASIPSKPASDHLPVVTNVTR